MPAKKSTANSGSNSQTTATNSKVLTGAYIKSARELEMLKRLIESSNALESITTSSRQQQQQQLQSDSQTSSSSFWDDDFVSVLLSVDMVRSPNAEIRLMVACILADILRLSLGPLTPAAASRFAATDIPCWKKDHHQEVLQLFIDALSASPANNSNIPNRRHILESLAVSHALVPLIRHSKTLKESQKSQLFHGLLNITSTTNQTNNKNKHNPKNLYNIVASANIQIDDAYASAAASAITDIFTADQQVEEEQVALLVSCFGSGTAISSSGNAAGGGGDDAADENETTKTTTTKKSSKKASTAALTSDASITIGNQNNTSQNNGLNASKKIAAAAFRRRELEPAQQILVSLLAEKFETVANDINAIEIEGAEDAVAQTSKKAKELHQVLNRAVDLALAAPNAVSLVLPALANLSTNLESETARTLLVKYLGKAFVLTAASASSSSSGGGTNNTNLLAVEFAGPLITLAGRVVDIRPQVRLAAVTFISNILAAHQEGTSTNADSLWQQLPQQLITALNDTDESVRKISVTSVFDSLARSSIDKIPIQLLKAAGLRCLDRRQNVRLLAIEKCANFYQQYRASQPERCSWIPNRIFETMHLELDASIVEKNIENLLPHPSKTSSSSGGGAGGNQQNQNQNKSSKKQQQQKSQSSLFDFGFFDSSSNVNNANAANATNTTTMNASFSFTEAFVALLEDLDVTHRETIFALMHKKRTLRMCVDGLFSARNEAKSLGREAIGTDIGARITDKIHRFIAVLNTKTQCQHNETYWDTLFKLKDERAVKGLLNLCGNEILDYGSFREEARSRLGASLKKDVQTYVEKNLLPRLALPFSQAHVTELVILTAETRRQISSQTIHSSPETIALIEKRYLSQIDALHAISKHSPQLLVHVASDLVSWVTEDGLKDQPEEYGTVISRLLEVFTTIALFSETNQQQNQNKNNQNQNINNPFLEKSVDIVRALGKLCLFSRHHMVGAAAAQAICKMFPDRKEIYKKLIDALKDRIEEAANQKNNNSFSSWSPFLGGWLACFGKFLQLQHQNIKSVAADISKSCSKILIAACLTSSSASAASSDNVNKKQEDIELLPASGKKAPNLATVISPVAQIVDAAASAIVTYAKSITEASRSIPTQKEAFATLVGALKHCAVGNSTGLVGSVLKRLALYKHILSIVENPPDNDLNLELQAAICFSAESNAYARGEVQKMISTTCQNGNVDVRYLALLVMTAITEEQRSTFNIAKSHLQQAVDKMAQRRNAIAKAEGSSSSSGSGKNKNQDGATAKDEDDEDEDEDDEEDEKETTSIIAYSDPRALKLYPEYCIPFLVFYLAHHSFYESEKQANFNAFQRVWYLLFEVMLKQHSSSSHGGTSSVLSSIPFIQEMWRKIKTLDDVLDRDSDNIREMVDLGAKVLQSILAQKQVPSSGFDTFPGQILLPRCFVPSSSSSSSGGGRKANKVYLSNDINVGTHAPFKAAPAITPAKFGGAVGSSTVKRSRGAGVKSASVSAGRDDDDDDDQLLTDAFDVRRNLEQTSSSSSSVIGTRRGRAGQQQQEPENQNQNQNVFDENDYYPEELPDNIESKSVVSSKNNKKKNVSSMMSPPPNSASASPKNKKSPATTTKKKNQKQQQQQQQEEEESSDSDLDEDAATLSSLSPSPKNKKSSSAASSSSSPCAKGMPKPPKSMPNAVFETIREVVEDCPTHQDLMKMSLKKLQKRCADAMGENEPLTGEIKDLIRDYVSDCLQC